jgi:hypothetical protein
MRGMKQEPFQGRNEAGTLSGEEQSRNPFRAGVEQEPFQGRNEAGTLSREE